jgi:hypothetical protein
MFLRGATNAQVVTTRPFAAIPLLSGDHAWVLVSTGGARQLRDLLSAVRMCPAGGQHALELLGDRKNGAAIKLAYLFRISHHKS